MKKYLYRVTTLWIFNIEDPILHHTLNLDDLIEPEIVIDYKSTQKIHGSFEST